MAAEIAAGLGGAAKGYRRLLVMAAVLGAVALGASIALGHYVAGLAFLGGLLLGWINTMMTVASAGKYARSQNPAKGPIVMSTLRRLAAFTAIALIVAYVLRPDGVAIIFGLVFFHMMMVGSTSRGLITELRRTEP